MVRRRGQAPGSGAVLAHVDAGSRAPGDVLDQEARGAGELVGLLRGHLDREGLVGEVGARELVGLGELGLVLVHLAGGLVLVAGREAAGLEALFLLLVLGLARCVVVSSHAGASSRGGARMLAPEGPWTLNRGDRLRRAAPNDKQRRAQTGPAL